MYVGMRNNFKAVQTKLPFTYYIYISLLSHKAVGMMKLSSTIIIQYILYMMLVLTSCNNNDAACSTR